MRPVVTLVAPDWPVMVWPLAQDMVQHAGPDGQAGRQPPTVVAGSQPRG
jgi:hypothetical protein